MASSASARRRPSSTPAGSATPAWTTRPARTSRAGTSTPACATSSRLSTARAASRTARCLPSMRTIGRAPISARRLVHWSGVTRAGSSKPAAPKVEDLDYAGALAGGQVGYNLQVGQTVYGIEGRLRLEQCPWRRVLPEPEQLHLRSQGGRDRNRHRSCRSDPWTSPVLRQGRLGVRRCHPADASQRRHAYAHVQHRDQRLQRDDRWAGRSVAVWNSP